MNIISDPKNQRFVEYLNTYKNIAIFASKHAGTDSFAAAAGLYQMLKEMPQKKVSLVYQGKLPEFCQDLVASDEIISEFSNKTLEVSINYANTNASSVKWDTDTENVVKLRLGPLPKDFDYTNNVTTKLIGLEFDLAIVIGAQYLSDLGTVYSNLDVSFAKAAIINIDNTVKNSNYGNLTLNDTLSDTLSMIVFKNASAWGLVPNQKAALALLTGLSYRGHKAQFGGN